MEMPLASFACQRDTSLSNCVGVSCKNKGRKLVGSLAMSNKGEPMLLISYKRYKRACCKRCLPSLNLFASFEHVHKNNLCTIIRLCHSEPPLNGMLLMYRMGSRISLKTPDRLGKKRGGLTGQRGSCLNMETCSFAASMPGMAHANHHLVLLVNSSQISG